MKTINKIATIGALVGALYSGSSALAGSWSDPNFDMYLLQAQVEKEISEYHTETEETWEKRKKESEERWERIKKESDEKWEKIEQEFDQNIQDFDQQYGASKPGYNVHIVIEDVSSIEEYAQIDQTKLVSKYLESLLTIPDQPLAKTKSHNFCIQTQVAENIIESYAYHVNPDQILEAKDGVLHIYTNFNLGSYLKARQILIKALQEKYSQPEITELKKTNAGVWQLLEGVKFGSE